jgi:hypothetical protein
MKKRQKHDRPKLTVSSETIRLLQLNRDQLDKVVGGQLPCIISRRNTLF